MFCFGKAYFQRLSQFQGVYFPPKERKTLQYPEKKGCTVYMNVYHTYLEVQLTKQRMVFTMISIPVKDSLLLMGKVWSTWTSWDTVYMCILCICPDLPLPYIFGTCCSQLPIYQVTRSLVPNRELKDEGIPLKPKLEPHKMWKTALFGDVCSRASSSRATLHALTP